MTPPTPDRQRELALLAFEAALRRWSADGAQPNDDVRWLVARLALSAPAVAARCGRVLAVLDPETRAAVRCRVTVPVTELAVPPGDPAPSVQVSATAAARMLGMSNAGVRAAARRGRLPGTRSESGRWHLRVQDVEEYGRAREQRQAVRGDGLRAAARPPVR